MIFAWGLLIGLFCPPILIAAVLLGAWAFRRNGPTWTCDACFQLRRAPFPGEKRNITVWASGVRHELFTSRRAWHRKAWAADEWNPANL